MSCHLKKFRNSTVEVILNELPNICLQRIGETDLMSTAEAFKNASQMNDANKFFHLSFKIV